MNQMMAAISSYLSGSPEIALSYLNAFSDDPIAELEKVMREPIFVTAVSDIFLGADYHRKNNLETLKLQNAARKKNVEKKVTLERQMEIERNGEFKALLSKSVEMLLSEAEEPLKLNAFWCSIELGQRVRIWSDLGGNPPDLAGYAEFYKSDQNTKTPYNDISSTLYAKIMVDPQPIKSGDAMDIEHISSLMPYSDLFITDKHWSTFLNRKGLAVRYNTKVCYIGDTDIISEFFENFAK